MPNIKSAKKRVKVTATKTLQNRMLKGNLKAALKAANAAIESDAADKAAVAQKSSTSLLPRESSTRTRLPDGNPRLHPN